MTDRKTYIGSSDARDILSGDWDAMWRRKAGIDPDVDLSDNFAVQLGVHTEPFHLDWTLRRLAEEGSAEWSWSKGPSPDQQHFSMADFDGVPLGSHPDALIRHPSDPALTYPVEVKITARFRNADEAADFYMPQLQHHMLAWGTDLILLSVVCGTSEPERLWVGHSPEWQAHYLDRCREFWNLVLAGAAPRPVFFDGVQPAPKVPSAIRNSVPINGMTRRDMTGNNRWKAISEEFLSTREAHGKHERAKKDLKALMEDTEACIYDERMELKRDKRGAIRINIKEDA